MAKPAFSYFFSCSIKIIITKFYNKLFFLAIGLAYKHI